VSALVGCGPAVYSQIVHGQFRRTGGSPPTPGTGIQPEPAFCRPLVSRGQAGRAHPPPSQVDCARSVAWVDCDGRQRAGANPPLAPQPERAANRLPHGGGIPHSLHRSRRASDAGRWGNPVLREVFRSEPDRSRIGRKRSAASHAHKASTCCRARTNRSEGCFPSRRSSASIDRDCSRALLIGRLASQKTRA
jgi:hypothetical protein